MEDPKFEKRRQALVECQLASRDIVDPHVIDAMGRVPRHRFVTPEFESKAYEDRPLPLGFEQTISQPYIVALMTQLAQLTHDSVVLDVGGGSGYQAAVAAEIASMVYSMEIVETLASHAADRLRSLGYRNVELRAADGYNGWPEHAPFDAIFVAAAPDHIPQPLIDQLKVGGKLVLPVGCERQVLTVVTKTDERAVEKTEVVPVVFVPMTGKALPG